MDFANGVIIHMARDCKPEAIKHVGAEMFSDKITIYRIAFFLAFAQKVIEENPLNKREIYEDVFKTIYSGMKF